MIFLEPWVSNTIPSHKKKSCGLRIPRGNFGKILWKKERKICPRANPPLFEVRTVDSRGNVIIDVPY